MKEINVDKLEKTNFTIEKKAFRPTKIICSKCKSKTKKTELEIDIGNNIFIRALGFRCEKCNKEYLGLNESKKLDSALILSRFLNLDTGFRLERKLSFDGDNYTFRIPKEFASHVHKRKIEIVPLNESQFCCTVE